MKGILNASQENEKKYAELEAEYLDFKGMERYFNYSFLKKNFK